MSERKPGWYWVRHGHEQASWEAAEWNGARWHLVGSDDLFSELEVPVVGPRIPTPDEPWQCVPVESTWQMEGVADIDPYDYQQILAVAPKP